MKNKTSSTLSRREFARRAAMLSATASLMPCEVVRVEAAERVSEQAAENAAKLTGASQTEADSRYQQILSLYSDRLDDAQKANVKRMCAELQPSLERLRSFKLENGEAPALYLKPFVERDKKPQPQAGTSSSKPGSPTNH